MHLWLLPLGASLLNLVPGPHRRLLGLIIAGLFEVLKHLTDPRHLEEGADLVLHAAGHVTKQACYCAEVDL